MNILRICKCQPIGDGSRSGEFADATKWEMKGMQKENGTWDDVEAGGN